MMLRNTLVALVAAVARAGRRIRQAYRASRSASSPPTAPGGTSDIFVARSGEEMQKRLGQPVVVENRSGGGMNSRRPRLRRSANDGYSICILPNEVLKLKNEFTFKSIPYQSGEGLRPHRQLLSSTPRYGGVERRSMSIRSASWRRCRRPSQHAEYSVLAIPMQITFRELEESTGADIVNCCRRAAAATW